MSYANFSSNRWPSADSFTLTSAAGVSSASDKADNSDV